MPSLELPKGWVECTLADIVTINPKNNAAAELAAGFIPMSHAPTKYYGELQFQEKVWGEIQKSYTNFANGDVIFAKVTPCFENGKAAVVENMPNGIGAGSSEFYVLRPLASTISPKLIYALIKSQPFMQQGAQNMTGAVGLRRVPRAFVEKFPVALPPLAEQKVIADKLDILLAQVETTKARLERIPQILKRFRQSVLAAAVSGRLTECLANEFQEVAVEDIAKKEKYSLGIGPFGSNLKVSDYRESGHPLVFVREIRARSFGDAATKFVSSEKFEALSAHRVCPGDILITKMGDPPGDVAIYPLGRPEAVITSDCIKLSVNESVADRDYVAYAMQAESFRRSVLSISAGVAQQKVSLTKFRKLRFLLPPLEEQLQTVHRVNQLFTHADRIEQQVQSALERVNHLTQSILAKAFRGELTEQWRKDNPELISGENSAAALLERIKTERAAMQPAKKGRRTKVSS